jgi:hypothetical protein
MPNPPFADATGRLAVRAARLLDVESGATLPDRTLLVTDGRVEAVFDQTPSNPTEAAVRMVFCSWTAPRMMGWRKAAIARSAAGNVVETVCPALKPR